MLGAYVRLSDAGLGCPDWPGCYGKLTPTAAAADISRAVAEQGGEHGWVSMNKAWKEMAHRYFAALLGLAIIAIAGMAVRRRKLLDQSPALALILVGVVIMQGLFGKTAIHPSQIELIEKGFRVKARDVEEARRILMPDAAAVFKMNGRMCEPTTHNKWAQAVIERAELYGVIE